MTNAIVNPEILKWARETAGLDMAEAAERLGLNSTKKSTAEEKLSEIEAGNKAITRTQLLKFASVYRRPLISFYLKKPPVKADRGEDFRQAVATITVRENALLDALLRDLRARQQMVRSLIEDEEAPANPIAGCRSIQDGIDVVVTEIARRLDFDFTDKNLRRRGPEELFKLLRAKTEDAGIFVLLVGDLGSHHTSLSADVFRGFAIADKIAPFIVINDQDARAARSFTLLHEIAHIVIGESGVSGAPKSGKPHDAHDHIERFCNDVAGEFLLSRQVLGSKPPIFDVADKDEIKGYVTAVAAQWAVSESMSAYRMNRVGWISDDIYNVLVAEYIARWRAIKQKTKDERDPEDGGPSAHIVRQSKLGSALVGLVRHAVRESILTHTKAAQILGVKPTSVEPLLRVFEQMKGARIHKGDAQ